ncbi:hypothetical protein FSP39_007563 [Pinctada imbricata]|uniref:Importin N-terminal domain-containing protein n=1 Tax=Pinctada imbricata TaxID=66713 RepID=A0AA89BWD7_PINIB|nr:hypothetical protein FSP39_007563 [Pinctada imbricata]
MTEFFEGHTSNERKKEIESILQNFSQTRDAWKHCLYYLANTQNEYVMMYCMTETENLINRQWLGFPSQDKLEIRSTLNRFLLEHHDHVPSYIRNKLVKLVVDIGRIDWPHFYPDFFSSILQLSSQSETVILGILLLHTASEELAAPREDLSMARKEELQRLLLTQVPSVLSILNNTLESVLEKHRHLIAATPPPSPTSGRSMRRSSSSALFSTSPLQSDSILSNMFKSPGSKIPLEALPPLDNDSQLLCCHALKCLSQYFSWIPLSTTITPSLLSTIFHFAGFGCEKKKASSTNTSNVGFNTNTSVLGILAMDCINELLAKNCVPREFEDYLLQMFQQTFYLLQKLTRDSSTNATGNRLAEIDESYLEKFTDFLKLFVSIHLRRFESNSKFPVLEFLTLLLKYTFKQPTHEGFYNCLDTWNTFLDYLHSKLHERGSDSLSLKGRYQEGLLSLVSSMMQKLQYRFNQSQLEELDDEVLDDDSETEWQQFLRQSLEVVAKVAEIYTADTFRLLYEPFNEQLEVYLGLEQFILNNAQGRQLTITAENECRKLHCSLRDLSSLIQALGRLAEHFIGEKFLERFADGTMLIERLVHTVVYGSKSRLFDVMSTIQNVLPSDFVEVHAQSIASVKAYSHWLSQYNAESQREVQEKAKFKTLITTLLNSLVPLLSKETPERIVHSIAHLLLSISTTVRPVFLLDITSVQTMFNNASQGVYGELSTEVQLLVYRSLSNSLILPWPNLSDPDQDWTSRSSHHLTFVQKLAQYFLQLKNTAALTENKALQAEAKPVIKRTLQVFEDWIEAVAGEINKSKQICYQSLQEVIQVALALFPVYISQSDVVDSMMSFFLALFQGLRVQMGVPFAEQTIQTFMNFFTQEHLAAGICQESSTGHSVVEKFLKILELIVQEPGSSFKAFLPRIISICMDQIYPIIAQRPSPDIKHVLYHLLHELLMNNWRYFFRGSVLLTLQKQETEMQNPEQFKAILEAYGQSFLQPDLAVFKHNLESLESINSKWKLYHKPIFQNLMLFQFLNVLIQVLVHKSHDLLQEEIVVSVYNMASVDFDRFYAEFLPHFLSQVDRLDSNQKAVLAQNFEMERDLPSFTSGLQRLVNDIRYYRLINSSRPEGSFSF